MMSEITKELLRRYGSSCVVAVGNDGEAPQANFHLLSAAELHKLSRAMDAFMAVMNEPIAPDAPPLHLEVNEDAANIAMAKGIDMILDASNRPESPEMIYTERDHPDDDRPGTGPS